MLITIRKVKEDTAIDEAIKAYRTFPLSKKIGINNGVLIRAVEGKQRLGVEHYRKAVKVLKAEGYLPKDYKPV
ncbi:MAG: hypothetical protein WCP97_00400 [bacterium]